MDYNFNVLLINFNHLNSKAQFSVSFSFAERSDFLNIKVTNMLLCHNNDILKAVASVSINDEFAINKIRLIRRPFNSKLIVSMPSKLNNEGKYIDYVHPIRREVRKELERVILEKYKQMTTGGKTNE